MGNNEHTVATRCGTLSVRQQWVGLDEVTLPDIHRVPQALQYYKHHPTHGKRLGAVWRQVERHCSVEKWRSDVF
jgi:hypothetical protein